MAYLGDPHTDKLRSGLTCVYMTPEEHKKYTGQSTFRRELTGSFHRTLDEALHIVEDHLLIAQGKPVRVEITYDRGTYHVAYDAGYGNG